MLPILERLLYRPKNTAVTRVLVLVPTRELAVQVHTVARQLSQFTNVECCLAVGKFAIVDPLSSCLIKKNSGWKLGMCQRDNNPTKEYKNSKYLLLDITSLLIYYLKSLYTPMKDKF